ncbi:hypothetical protein [Brevundimonas sp.]
MATYAEQMQALHQRYRIEVSATANDPRDIAAWAISKGLWHPKPSDIHARFASDMADALREEYRTDKAGRRYRANHAIRATSVDGKQMSLWDDIDTAPRSHMEKAFAMRRRQIVGDCHQARLDVDHYNSVHQDEEPVQFILDFTDDVAEMLVAEGVEEAA